MAMGQQENIGPERRDTPLGQYYILDKIAEGGMAEIYKGLAYDLNGIKKTVVIKKIRPEIAADKDFVNMLINEAKIAVMLSHGNIAQIYDLGKVEGDYFMVMEYVDGQSLSKLHKRCMVNGTLIPREYTCYIISEVASGLNYMHRRTDEQGRNLGIIHRDISPQNIIISYSGTVKIIDFGIAKAAIRIHTTDSGVLKGKFAYMSPEQALGEAVDHRTDIFSLGVVLYELLTGRRLFKGKDKRETLQNVRKCEVPPLIDIIPDIQPELERIVMKTLEKDPCNRYMWASELRDDLTKFIYTNYPDFQPSKFTEFIREVFKNEIEDAKEAEEELKTPLLILDKTQSALFQGASDVTALASLPKGEVSLLDEQTPSQKEIGEGEETRFKKITRLFSYVGQIANEIKGHFKKVAVATVSVFIIALITYIALVKTYVIEPPARFKFLMPPAKLVMHLEPSDAEILLGETKIKGSKSVKIKNIAPNEEYRLIVEKDGYLPYTTTIRLKEGEKRTLDIKLEPEPPHFGSLTISSRPPGASIFINNEKTNLTTPTTIKTFKPNTYYSIGLYLDGYKYAERDLIFKPDEEKDLDVELEREMGEVDIISSPEGAAVIIDGNFVGYAPIKITGLQIGKVLNITVKKEGYTEFNQKVEIKGGAQPIILRPRLERKEELLVPEYIKEIMKKKEAPTNIGPTPPTEEAPTEEKGRESEKDYLPPAPLAE